MAPANSDEPKKWSRASTPRVKTGCANCRKRHIKCDETRPSCTKCIKGGWRCDGYSTPTASRGSPEQQPSRQVARARKPNPLMKISSYSLPFRIPGSQKDRQLLHYFCTQGSSDISGFLSSKFWSHTILQNSHHEPAVRQALVALSSLHLDRATSDPPPPSPGGQLVAVETLQQQGKALRMLTKRLETGDEEAVKVALLCCVLFFCFESTVGNNDAALRHLSKGLEILSSKLVQSHKPVDDLDAIANVLARLDLQATMHDDDRPPAMVLTTAEERQAGITKEPRIPFSTFEEAQKSLDKLQNWLFHFLVTNVSYKRQPVKSIPVSILQEKQQLDQEYGRWLQKFSHPIATPDDGHSSSGIQILLIHHRVTLMLLHASLPGNADVFGASPNPAAEEVLNLTESILNNLLEKNATAETAKNPRRNLASDTGIIAPLSLLAIKCADPFAQEKALELLALSQRQEGLYDATTMVNVVQGLTDIKNMRLQMALQEGIMHSRPRSLEYWTVDIIDGQAGEFITGGASVPATVLHPPGSSMSNIPV